jgi:predicted ATP-grasp superfamily ATP-dependent carboligase
VLITDAENRSVLAAARGLAAAGFEVGATMASRSAPGAWSRAVSDRFVTGAVDGPCAVEGIARSVEERGHELLLPGTDAAVFAVSLYRDRLPAALRHGLPPHELVLKAFDREELSLAGEAVGLPAPPSMACANEDDLRAAAEDFGFPLFVKPAAVVSRHGGLLLRQASCRATDHAELLHASLELGMPVLVQGPVQGPVISVGGVLADGELRASAVSRYLRTWPAAAGNVSFSRTVSPPAGLLEATTRLVAELGWEGIFELELVQREDGGLVPIDFNPRVYGSLDLAVKAGANLPAVWCSALMGQSSEPVSARVGVSYRWGDADLRHAIWQARRGNAQAALQCLRPRISGARGYFDAADPAPAAARASELVSAGFRRGSAAEPRRGRGAAAVPLVPRSCPAVPASRR